eukprot:284603-Pelagomonas_calceolata.AAC.1
MPNANPCCCCCCAVADAWKLCNCWTGGDWRNWTRPGVEVHKRGSHTEGNVHSQHNTGHTAAAFASAAAVLAAAAAQGQGAGEHFCSPRRTHLTISKQSQAMHRMSLC